MLLLLSAIAAAAAATAANADPPPIFFAGVTGIQTAALYDSAPDIVLPFATAAIDTYLHADLPQQDKRVKCGVEVIVLPNGPAHKAGRRVDIRDFRAALRGPGATASPPTDGTHLGGVVGVVRLYLELPAAVSWKLQSKKGFPTFCSKIDDCDAPHDTISMYLDAEVTVDVVQGADGGLEAVGSFQRLEVSKLRIRKCGTTKIFDVYYVNLENEVEETMQDAFDAMTASQTMRLTVPDEVWITDSIVVQYRPATIEFATDDRVVVAADVAIGARTAAGGLEWYAPRASTMPPATWDVVERGAGGGATTVLLSGGRASTEVLAGTVRMAERAGLLSFMGNGTVLDAELHVASAMRDTALATAAGGAGLEIAIGHGALEMFCFDTGATYPVRSTVLDVDWCNTTMMGHPEIVDGAGPAGEPGVILVVDGGTIEDCLHVRAPQIPVPTAVVTEVLRSHVNDTLEVLNPRLAAQPVVLPQFLALVVPDPTVAVVEQPVAGHGRHGFVDVVGRCTCGPAVDGATTCSADAAARYCGARAGPGRRHDAVSAESAIAVGVRVFSDPGCSMAAAGAGVAVSNMTLSPGCQAVDAESTVGPFVLVDEDAVLTAGCSDADCRACRGPAVVLRELEAAESSALATECNESMVLFVADDATGEEACTLGVDAAPDADAVLLYEVTGDSCAPGPGEAYKVANVGRLADGRCEPCLPDGTHCAVAWDGAAGAWRGGLRCDAACQACAYDLGDEGVEPFGCVTSPDGARSGILVPARNVTGGERAVCTARRSEAGGSSTTGTLGPGAISAIVAAVVLVCVAAHPRTRAAVTAGAVGAVDAADAVLEAAGDAIDPHSPFHAPHEAWMWAVLGAQLAATVAHLCTWAYAPPLDAFRSEVLDSYQVGTDDMVDLDGTAAGLEAWSDATWACSMVSAAVLVGAAGGRAVIAEEAVAGGSTTWLQIRATASGAAAALLVGGAVGPGLATATPVSLVVGEDEYLASDEAAPVRHWVETGLSAAVSAAVFAQENLWLTAALLGSSGGIMIGHVLALLLRNVQVATRDPVRVLVALTVAGPALAVVAPAVLFYQTLEASWTWLAGCLGPGIVLAGAAVALGRILSSPGTDDEKRAMLVVLASAIAGAEVVSAVLTLRTLASAGVAAGYPATLWTACVVSCGSWAVLLTGPTGTGAEAVDDQELVPLVDTPSDTDKADDKRQTGAGWWARLTALLWLGERQAFATRAGGRRMAHRRLYLWASVLLLVPVVIKRSVETGEAGGAKTRVTRAIEEAYGGVEWPDGEEGSMLDGLFAAFDEAELAGLALTAAALVVYGAAAVAEVVLDATRGLWWSRRLVVAGSAVVFCEVLVLVWPNYLALAQVDMWCPRCAPEFDAVLRLFLGNLVGLAAVVVLGTTVGPIVLALPGAIVRVAKQVFGGAGEHELLATALVAGAATAVLAAGVPVLAVQVFAPDASTAVLAAVVLGVAPAALVAYVAAHRGRADPAAWSLAVATWTFTGLYWGGLIGLGVHVALEAEVDVGAVAKELLLDWKFVVSAWAKLLLTTVVAGDVMCMVVE